ncbi:MAG: hypothetical protein FWD57_07525 [Polyangiaceae bacterium]|nr:hypothetical protein [Polyangiaceae bacterium]
MLPPLTWADGVFAVNLPMLFAWRMTFKYAAEHDDDGENDDDDDGNDCPRRHLTCKSTR